VKPHLVELEAKAIALKSAGRNVEASELFSRIIKEQPDWEHGTTFHLLGQCYEDAGKFALAEQNYREALKFEPKNDIFLGGLASFLYLHGEPQNAFDAYLDLLSICKSEARTADADSCIGALRALGKKIGRSESLITAKIDQNKRA